jgi:basic membrane protein A
MRVAARHPDVIFLETANRFSSSKAKNIGSYVMDYSAPMYVSGVVAARMSKSGNLGFVGAHPVPPLLVAINSFLLGAQSINPKVRVKVIWTNSWSDPATEAEATKSLAEQGADVIASNLDSSMPSSEAAERVHAYAVGTHADLSRKAPKAWLTGLRFDWGKLDIQLARSINERKWKPGTTFLDSTSDFSTLLPFGQSVPKPVQSEALRTLQLFRSGKLKVFVGPMKDRDGIERIPKGKVLGLEELQDLSWLAPGVEGSLPKQ